MGCCINKSNKIAITKIKYKNKSGEAISQTNLNISGEKSKIQELIEDYEDLMPSKIEKNQLIKRLENKVEKSYKIIKNIGKGSYGKVFLVKHKNSGELRAMKVILKENIKYQDGEQNFLNELDILMRTEHPNIIKIFEYYMDNQNYYLITEYVPGGNLLEGVIKIRHLTEQKAAYIVSQILMALNYLHNQGIIHRDIKPENILISSNNDGFLNLKLIDFGLSNYFTTDKKFYMKVGSPFYIAPEVLKHNYNYKCDIWSTGVILYVLLIGQFPFYAKTKEELFQKILNGKIVMSEPAWNLVSNGVKDLLRHMLEYDYEKRYSSLQCLEHKWLSQYKDINLTKKIDTKNLGHIMNNLSQLQKREHLQQATIAYITYSFFSSTEKQCLQNLFCDMDINGDGQITLEEFKEGIKKYYENDYQHFDLDKIFKEIDSNGDGEISYEEFLRATVNVKKILTQKNLKLAFEHFDLNGDGKLSKDELRAALNTSDYEYVDKLLSAIDTNNDGVVSFEEFKKLMEHIT